MRAPLLRGEAEAIARRVALEEGVDPDLFIGLWGQESSYSTDPTMLGKTKTRHGYAKGPFQIMESLHGALPDDFEAQARKSAQILKAGGLEGYYGRGKALPGQPTTAEYVAQVRARAGKPLQVASAGRPDIEPGLQTMPASLPVAEDVTMAQGNSMGGLEQLMASPGFLLGAGLLSQAGGQSGAVGRGLLGGATAHQSMQQSRALEEARRLQIEMARQRQIEEQQNEQMRMEFLRRIQGGGGQPGAGVSPQDLARIGMEGAVMGVPGAGAVMQYGLGTLPYGAMTQADQAEARDRELRRAMEVRRLQDEGVLPMDGAAAGGISPRGVREREEESAKAEAKKRAEYKVDLPKIEMTTQEALQTIDTLLNHPGRELATGMSAMLPLIPGTAPYDFNAKLGQAQGQVFLRAYETLKGGGQITEVEGKKAEQATAALDRAQSEEQFVKALQDLRTALQDGLRKAREKAGVQGAMENAQAVDFLFEGGRLVPAR